MRFLTAVWSARGDRRRFCAIFLAALFCEYIDSALGMGYGTTLTPLLLLAGFDPLEIVPFDGGHDLLPDE